MSFEVSIDEHMDTGSQVHHVGISVASFRNVTMANLDSACTEGPTWLR